MLWCSAKISFGCGKSLVIPVLNILSYGHYFSHVQRGRLWGPSLPIYLCPGMGSRQLQNRVLVLLVASNRRAQFSQGIPTSPHAQQSIRTCGYALRRRQRKPPFRSSWEVQCEHPPLDIYLKALLRKNTVQRGFLGG